MNALVVLNEKVNQNLTLYNTMTHAISVCHSVDECKEIVDRTVALAAYYKQIEDAETELKYKQVRMRAWRRVAEIVSEVDIKKCKRLRDKADKIRAAFNRSFTRQLSDARINQLLKLGALSKKDFEDAVNQNIAGHIKDLLRRTPQAREWTREMEEERRRIFEDPEHLEELKKIETDFDEKLDFIDGTQAATDEALSEVGYTLDRHDRMKMKQVLFLIKEKVHAVMRQAAFDEKITMQEILRRGLRIYLTQHGYKFPEE